mmetsp:Transcript_49355/g.148616  ORF Transcript_49355/g.148616 Transcript_49355/m.148616 type:complete len:88 (-) Transcript_49355:705-968(-)
MIFRRSSGRRNDSSAILPFLASEFIILSLTSPEPWGSSADAAAAPASKSAAQAFVEARTLLLPRLVLFLLLLAHSPMPGWGQQQLQR